MEYIKLNDGNKIPAFGFGTFLIPNDGSTYKAVKTALDHGIKHIDTATAYFNEQEVGQAIKDSEIERDDIWITSKLWIQDFAYEDAKKAIDLSLEKLGTDYMDMYLIHQPFGKVNEAWKAMEEAKEEGKIHSIGVSNMTPKIWNTFIPDFETLPAVNQVEFNPYFQEKELSDLIKPQGVKIEAWGPLGQGNPELLNNPTILEIAENYGKTSAQIILKFENQEEVIVFPKSTNPERIKSNMDIFDFELTKSEMDKIRNLDTNKRTYDPEMEGIHEWLLSECDVHAND